MAPLTAATAGRARLRRGLVIACAAAAAAWLTLAAAVRWFPLPQGYWAPPSTVMTWRDGSVAHVFLAEDDRWRIPARLERVDPRYVQALLRFEDRRFVTHSGVDAAAVLRAAWSNLTAGRVVSGASTLTMQLARMREPRPRTLFSKVQEAFRAWQIEVRLTKHQILEKYLTYAPYGRNFEGVETASWAFFGHGAETLSPAEIAVLLAVPQDPSHRHPTPEHREALDRAARAVAERVWPDDEQALREVRSTPVPAAIRSFPRRAPHVAYALKARHPGPDPIETHLDAELQARAERTMDRWRQSLADRGIRHGAALLVEHEAETIRAAVGNLDYWSEDEGDKMAAFDRPRSPGSTLKPFLFALGIDEGRVLPETVVDDVPRHFADYSPENYDGRFRGRVRLDEALAASLNLPFIDLLQQLGVDRFIGHLQSWGARSVVDRPGHYGLSAAIGGVELTPMEVLGLYAMLARGGKSADPVWVGTPRPSVRALSKGAAYLTRQALRTRDRPDFANRSRFTGQMPGVFWKTGTSYGHLDAWAVGGSGPYTALVWLGNLDRTPSDHLVGAEAAGPILFDLLEAALPGGNEGPDPRPGDLIPVQVCPVSGRLPGPDCPQHGEAWAVATHVPTERCSVHVGRWVDRSTGWAVRPGCRSAPGLDLERRVYQVWPGPVRRYLSAGRTELPGPPAWAPDCAVGGTRPPRIRIATDTVLLVPGLPAEAQEVPVDADAETEQLAWFVDGHFVLRQPADRRFWWTPEPGTHRLTAVDDAGKADGVDLTVLHPHFANRP